jgi:pseudaminic acid synthase
MKIAGREIGPSKPPYIVAEVGANHGGELDRALRLIEAAKAAGADAVKLQAYTADTITLDCDGPGFRLTEGPWQGWNLYDLYAKCQTPFEWFPAIAAHARKVGIPWFASAFDFSAIDMLLGLDVPAIKIASFELVDLPLIRYAADTGKPLILSTGMARDSDIDDAIAVTGDNPNIAILHCVSGYPTPIEQANLSRFRMMWQQMWRRFDIGISDHTIGIEVPVAATALGACMIEKHFTMSHRRKTPDSMFSLEPIEFKRMADAVRTVWQALQPGTAASEAPQRALRRSLYAVADIAAGEPFTAANVRSIRPGHGLPPKDIDAVLGKTAARAIARGTPLAWDMVR